MKYHPNLKEFVGQNNLLKQALGIITMKNWSMLLRGHYGYGKTELARVLAARSTFYSGDDTRLFYYPIPQWEAAMVPPEGGASYTVIIDECHLNSGYEWLYRAMEVNNYIFCSNMASELPEPFISRCFTLRLDNYTEAELLKIILLHAYRQGIVIPIPVAAEIAKRSRGTPRTGVFFMRKYLAMYKPRYDRTTIADYFKVEGIDGHGYGSLDRKYLKALQSGYKSKRTLQMILDVDARALDRIERYLIQRGMVVIETRGRRLV